MAEFVFKDLAKKAGRSEEFLVESRATSYEAVGCDVHHGTQSVLNAHGVPWEHRSATRLESSDYHKYDLIITMEQDNIRNLLRRMDDPEGKIHNLLEYAGSSRDIADPWYTGNFDTTYRDVVEGCKALLESI